MTVTPCNVPPAGWRCTRDAGHTGPCAALPLQPPDGGIPDWLQGHLRLIGNAAGMATLVTMADELERRYMDLHPDDYPMGLEDAPAYEVVAWTGLSVVSHLRHVAAHLASDMEP